MLLRPAARGTAAALLAVLTVSLAHGASQRSLTPSLAKANAALQAGEADNALGMLESLPAPDASTGSAANLECRVYLELEQWDSAVTNCQQAVQIDGQDSNFHMWLGRALGMKADHAIFLTAYSLAKRVRAEFEEAVRLDPRNADALADLGQFYVEAPGVVGGGVDKADGIAAQLEKVDAAGAHRLRGEIAEQRKDYSGAEHEFKMATVSEEHRASDWIALAGFYRRRERWTDMETAIHIGEIAADRDKVSGLALYDGASVLIETHRDPTLAAKMLEDYLAGSSKTEEAPAFVAHIRLARLKDQLGDAAGASRERAAALALANNYKAGPAPTH